MVPDGDRRHATQSGGVVDEVDLVAVKNDDIVGVLVLRDDLDDEPWWSLGRPPAHDTAQCTLVGDERCESREFVRGQAGAIDQHGHTVADDRTRGKRRSLTRRARIGQFVSMCPPRSAVDAIFLHVLPDDEGTQMLCSPIPFDELDLEVSSEEVIANSWVVAPANEDEAVRPRGSRARVLLSNDLGVFDHGSSSRPE